MLRARAGLIVGVVGFVGAFGCASQAGGVGEDGTAADETTGETSEALTLPKSICGQSALASIDDIPAYRNDCGDHTIWSNNGMNTRATAASGYVETEEAAAGYQCVELAIRYSYFKFDVSTHWGIEVAADMCAHHPAGTSTTSSPVHGDLMVFPRGGHLGPYGHVAVVSSVSGSTIHVVQENVGTVAATAYPKSWASCFIHAARNNDCGDAANSSYCGDTTAFKAGTKGTLYTCVSHEVKSKTVCKYGCDSVSGAADKCNPAPADAGEDGGDDDGGDNLTTNYDDGGPDDDSQNDAGDGVQVYGDDGGDQQTTAPVTPATNTSESGGCNAAPQSPEKDSRAMWLVGLGAVMLLTRRRRA